MTGGSHSGYFPRAFFSDITPCVWPSTFTPLVCPMPKFPPTWTAERFHQSYHEEPNTGCWLWTGKLDKDGYGRAGKPPAYHLALQLHGIPVPPGMEPDHLCRVRCCVNPTHLEIVTHTENLLRGQSLQAQNARKTHCPQGHPYTPENTYIQVVNSRNWRICRTCRRAAKRNK